MKTAAAKENGKSNCPLCALGTDNNAKRIWKYTEMDADHELHGVKAGLQIFQIVKCFAKLITGQRETDRKAVREIL